MSVLFWAISALFVAISVLLVAMSVLFWAMSALFVAISVLLVAMSVLFWAISALFVAISVLLVAMSVLFWAISALFVAISVLLVLICWFALSTASSNAFKLVPMVTDFKGSSVFWLNAWTNLPSFTAVPFVSLPIAAALLLEICVTVFKSFSALLRRFSYWPILLIASAFLFISVAASLTVAESFCNASTWPLTLAILVLLIAISAAFLSMAVLLAAMLSLFVAISAVFLSMAVLLAAMSLVFWVASDEAVSNLLTRLVKSVILSLFWLARVCTASNVVSANTLLPNMVAPIKPAKIAVVNFFPDNFILVSSSSASENGHIFVTVIND